MEEDYIIDESQVLANVIIDEDYQHYIEEINEKMLTNSTNTRLYNGAKELYDKGQLNLDNILIIMKKYDKYNDIYKLLTTYTPLNQKTMEFSINKLKENLLKRNLRSILTDSFNKLSTQANINDITSDLSYKINKLDTNSEKSDLKANTALSGLFDEIEEYESGKKSRIRTGIRMYDTYTAGGLKSGELTIIAGRPGTGKTTLALNIASNIAKTHKNVYFISLEMSSNQIMSKVLSYESGINSQYIYSGVWNKNDELDKISKGINVINDNYNLTINTSLRFLEDIIPHIKKLKAKNEIDVLIVDYIGLISTKRYNQTTRDKVSQISREFKLLSLDLDIPIILLSQLNREAQTREPSIADLRESGSCEQDIGSIEQKFNKCA